MNEKLLSNYSNRVQPGYCFHLFTQPRAQSLDDYQLPEMLRTPLEELCLQIKVHARTRTLLNFEHFYLCRLSVRNKEA